MSSFKTFSSKRDFVQWIQESLGSEGSRELAEKIWDYLWETAEHIGLPEWGSDWSRFLKDFDGWNILQTIEEYSKN